MTMWFEDWPKDNTCDCGSGNRKMPYNDGHGIFLFYGCEGCYDSKISGFRTDIHEHYECDEAIESEEF